MSWRRAAASFALCAALLATAARAQDDERSLEELSGREMSDLSLEDLLDRVVTTASRVEEGVRRVPSNITVVTAEQLREWGARDLRDVLKRVTGFIVAYDHDEWVVASRGNLTDDNLKYLVLIDGYRINSVEHIGPSPLLEMPNDLSNVRQIEIIRGPGSTLWGADALAGIINLITHDAGSLGKRARAKVTYGTHGTFKANVQVAHHSESGDFGVLAMAGLGGSGGRVVSVDAASRLPALNVETTGFDRPPLGRYTTNLDTYSPDVFLQGKAYAGPLSVNAYFTRSRVKNRLFGEMTADFLPFIRNENGFLDVLYKETFFKDLQLSGRAGMGTMRTDYLAIRGQADLYSWVSRRYSAQLAARKPLAQWMTLAGGLEYEHTTQGLSYKIEDIDLVALNTNDPRGAIAGNKLARTFEDRPIGLYAMSELQFLDQLHLTLGVRLDVNAARGEDWFNLSPRCGLVWEYTHRGALKLLLNSGLLRPSNYQSFGTPRPTTERMLQVDLVAMQTVGPVSLTANGFWQRLSSFVSNTGLWEDAAYQTSGDYITWGFELEGSARVLDKHTVFGGLSFAHARGVNYRDDIPMDARRIDPEGRVLNYPPLTAFLGGTARFGAFFVTPALRMWGPTRYRTAPALTSVADATYERTPALIYVDVTAGYSVLDWLELSVNLVDAFDNRARLPISTWNGTYEPFGRYFEGSVRLQL